LAAPQGMRSPRIFPFRDYIISFTARLAVIMPDLAGVSCAAFFVSCGYATI
jgi:hypothetical protein